MQRAARIRFLASAAFGFATLLPAQSSDAGQQAKPSAGVPIASTLPATPATASPSQQPPKHAQVAYANGTLSISADNSSLNQILRQISHDTGMTITGGVVDERVFGQYGPAPTAQILASLLDGTGSNMLLTHTAGSASAELVLTPRQGGPTPPNPNAHAFDDRTESPEVSASPEPPAAPEPAQPAPQASPNAANLPVTPTGAAPTNASQPDSPNGVKTPQQIYEQLQRMRQPQTQTATPQ